MTSEGRVAHSFSHYIATKLIELWLSVAWIAAQWLDTSSAVVEGHYNRFLNERQRHRLRRKLLEGSFVTIRSGHAMGT